MKQRVLIEENGWRVVVYTPQDGIQRLHVRYDTTVPRHADIVELVTRLTPECMTSGIHPIYGELPSDGDATCDDCGQVVLRRQRRGER